MTVLVITEHDSTIIEFATLNAVTAAKTCSNAETRILITGFNTIVAVQAATQITGVARVIHIDGASLADSLAEDLAAQVLTATASYSHILSPATTSGKNIAPRVAVKLDVAQISDIIKVKSFDTFERPIYAGSAIALVQSSDAIKVVTVRTTAFEAVAATGGSGAVEVTECVADSGQNRLAKREVTVSDRPELASARIAVSGGHALGSAERFSEVVMPLADKLDAAAGASRAMVDAGYTPNNLQVGQTGKIVVSQLYIALGIFGAIQHPAGMKDSKVIMVINKDPEAPIFPIADYGLAADLFIAVSELAKAL